jgi:hypothetical protein
MLPGPLHPPNILTLQKQVQGNKKLSSKTYGRVYWLISEVGILSSASKNLEIQLWNCSSFMLVILKFYLLLMVFGSNSLTVPKDFPSYYPREETRKKYHWGGISWLHFQRAWRQWHRRAESHQRLESTLSACATPEITALIGGQTAFCYTILTALSWERWKGSWIDRQAGRTKKRLESFLFLRERAKGSCCVAQDGPELLSSSNPPASAPW